jgi:cell division protein ZapA
MNNRQIDVQIMGQSYILGCPEGGEERLQGAVRKVDEAMCKIRDAGKIKARDRIAVLAALNLAYDQAEAPQAIDNHSASTPAADVSPDTEARLAQLLQRLDRVIEQDGQLL